MSALLWLIPALPLASAALLLTLRLPRALVSLTGVGSVALAAVLTAMTIFSAIEAGAPLQQTLWNWLALPGLDVAIGLRVDALTLVMLGVVTGVGLLIHLYCIEYMATDPGYRRFFAYMNLFVAAMLVLVMADNLLLLYLGWEGVGLCSYLLIGFWYRDPANGAAAQKAFLVTRVGDAAMLLGLLLLLREFGTLDIRQLLDAASAAWTTGEPMALWATALLLGGAVGKSAQLPLQSWLPDAMAGPTPVSALIHAATMVTAGVYLIARTHELFALAPPVLLAVALLGLATALMAACSALVQRDIKRILAWSTISQIGYMFLALGVGAWAAGIFHLMTHAFFKALLFLGAGAVIHALHHEQDIFKMGGLARSLPLVFWSMLIGAAALAALPPTSGFFSKDAILLAAWELPDWGPGLYIGALAGAAITALYSFRLVFVVFLGETRTRRHDRPSAAMAVPLLLLALLAAGGGLLPPRLESVFGAPVAVDHGLLAWIGAAVPLAGVVLAWLLWRPGRTEPAFTDSAAGRYWRSGWGFDALWSALLVRPYQRLAARLRREWVDGFYNLLVGLSRLGNRGIAATQTGRLRWYGTAMALGLILLLGLAVMRP